MRNIDTIKSTISSSSSTSGVIDIGIRYMPLIAILLLGLYALNTVIYKVATFGDCPEAGLELSKEILVAKEKLKSAGFDF